MVKKVFAIIGIVLGSVGVFVGGVFGIMAAMGKFKTPIVYPTVLEFVDNGQVVIEEDPYGGANLPTLHSFYLSGINPGSEDPVNKKTCYIWFDQNIGADLITLCDANRTPLEKNANNRYQVNCNEPIYYMINKVADNYETDGRVVIMARGENDKVQASNPLTLWIDREVDSVFVEYGDYPRRGEEQLIEIGVGISFDFKYVVNTPLSLKPMSKESAKLVELYYVATGHSDDYLKVTENEIANPDSPLHSILTIEEDVIKFNSLVAGEHEFKIAIFSTYEAKTKFEQGSAGVTFENPNYERLHADGIVVTTLTVDVSNIDISEVGFHGVDAVLNLYSQNDYITLDGTSGVVDAKENNLELFMKKGEVGNQVVDKSRFDEVVMNGFENAFVENKKPTITTNATVDVKLKNLVYKGNDTASTWQYYDTDNSQWITVGMANVVQTNICIGENLFIVEKLISDTAIQYYCNNGTLVIDTVTGEIKLLKVGSYLNFFVKEEENFVLASSSDFDYEIGNESKPINSGSNKSWNIISKSISEKDLCLGVLVVNALGTDNIYNMWDTIDVSVNEVELVNPTIQNNVDLRITFEGAETKYGKKQFNELVSVENLNSYSYNSLVYVIEEIAEEPEGGAEPAGEEPEGENGKYIVNTVDNIKFIVGEGESAKTYILVGNVEGEGENKTFKSVVELNSNVSKDLTTCELFVLQLKNGYLETVNDLIDKHLEEGKVFAENEIRNVFTNKTTVNASYVINKDLLSIISYTDENLDGNFNAETETVKDGNGLYTVYEKTENHGFVIASENNDMLKVMRDFYGVNADSFRVITYNDKLVITNLITNVITNGEVQTVYFILRYKAVDCLIKQETPIEIVLTGFGEEIYLPSVRILSGSPDNIVFNAKEFDPEEDKSSHQITLSNSREDANKTENNNYLKVLVSYNNGYIYKYYLVVNGGTPIYLGENLPFNTNISSPTSIYFQGAEDKKQTLPITYTSTDPSIIKTPFEDNFIKKLDTTVLKVDIGNTTKYLKVVVAEEKHFSITYSNQNNSYSINCNENNTEWELADKITFKYDGTPIAPLNYDNLINVDNIKLKRYGDGILQVFPYGENGYQLKKNEDDVTPILIIESTVNGWVFTKANQFFTLMIEFNVTSILETKTFSLTFNPIVQFDLNEEWLDKTFYAGTSVLLSSSETDDKPVFIAGSGVTFKMTLADDPVEQNEPIEILESLISDNASIYVYSGDSVFEYLGFKILPNISATFKDVDYESGKTHYISDLYNLQKYNDNENSVYGKDGLLYTENAKVNLGSLTNLTVGVEANKGLIGGTNLTIAPIQDLDITKKERIVLVYSNEETGVTKNLSENQISIINRYQVNVKQTNLTASTTIALSDVLTITDRLADAGADNVDDVVLDSVEIVGSEIDITVSADNDGKQYFNIPMIRGKLEDANFIFTLVINEDANPYVCSVVINVSTYRPTEKNKEDQVTAYSGASYDLLNGRYDAESWIDNDDIFFNSLTVVGIYSDENGEQDITGEVINGNFLESGFTGLADPKCEIIFKEIVGPSKLVYVGYRLSPKTGSEYTYYLPLTIENRQTLTINYPEDITFTSEIAFTFVDGYDEDGKVLDLNETENDKNLRYTLSGYKYEPVAIYTDNTVSINFKNDNIKKIVRANVSNNRAVAGHNENVDITLIAYEGIIDMYEYYGMFGYQTVENVLVLPQGKTGMSGKLLFKITTDSGRVDYYFIHVYCLAGSNENNVDVRNNQEFVVKKSSGDEDGYICVNKDSFTYDSIMGAINSTLFKKSYDSKTTLFLYEIKLTGGTTSNPHSLIVKDGENATSFTFDNFFTEITVGLIYTSGSIQYCYGTVTIFVQPLTTINIVVPEGVEDLSFAKSNGEFTANVDSNVESIASPFGTDWSAEIVKIGEDEYNSESHANYTYSGSVVRITKRVSEDVKILVKYTYIGEDGEGNEIKTYAFVTYTYLKTTLPTNNTSISIGDFNTTDGFKNTVTLTTTSNGETVYTSKYFDSYKGEFKVYDNTTELDDETDIEFKDGVLTFPQTTETQIKTITIEYTNLVDEEGQTPTRNFIFTIAPGVYVNNTNTGGESGLTSINAKSTDITNIDYTSKTGSNLNFNCSDEETYYKYEVGALIIYTSSVSFLELTFDDPRYVVTDDVATTLKGNVKIDSSNDTLGFVHSAEDKIVKMSIQVLANDYTVVNDLVSGTSSVEGYYQIVNGQFERIIEGVAEAGKVYYSNRSVYKLFNNGENPYSIDFYVKVKQTYTGIKAQYLVDGADHENVKPGEEKTLKDMFADDVNGRYRLILLGLDLDQDSGKYKPITSSYNLTNIGFEDDENPNKLTFSLSEDPKAIIDESGNIRFNADVTKNANTIILLSNSCGVRDVQYSCQTMVNPDSDTTKMGEDEYDGVDYLIPETKDENVAYASYINLKEGDNYIAFMQSSLNSNYNSESTDTDIYIGKMLDGNNSNIINGTVYIDDSVTDDFEIVVKDGKIYLNVKTTISGSTVTLTINAGGVNGGSSLINELTIILSASNVHYADGITNGVDLSPIYAGDQVRIDEKITSDLTTVEYQVAGGTFEYHDGHTNETITGNIVGDNLFKFIQEEGGSDDRFKIMVFNSVASDVNARVIFNIVENDKVVICLSYEFTVKLNLQIVINGEDFNNDTDLTYQGETVYVQQSGAYFPINVPLQHKEQIVAGGPNAKESDYYAVLAYDLYRFKDFGVFTDRDKAVRVELFSNHSHIVEIVDNNTLRFKKDYTGNIELKLSVATTIGSYYYIWTIRVEGIIQLNYKNGVADKGRIESESGAFESGTIVNIINGSSATDVAVTLSQSEYLAPQMPVKVAIYQYYIHTSNQDKTNEELFTDSDAIGSLVTVTENLGSNITTWSIALPTVPTSKEGKTTYYVTYKVWLRYMEINSDYFYVTYLVKNSEELEINKSNYNADTEIDHTTVTSKSYLDVMYYEEIFDVNNIINNIKYSGDNLQLTYNGTTYLFDENYAGTNDITKYFVNENNADDVIVYKLGGDKPKLMDTEGETIATRTEVVRVYRDNQEKVQSVYNSMFNNIFEFKEFVDVYTSENCITFADKNVFELEEIGDTGRYGIDLRQGVSGTDKLFDNEVSTELVLFKGDVPTYTITDFVIKATDKLIAKTIFVSDREEGIPLSEIILESNFTAVEDVKLSDIRVIGVGYPKNDWVKNTNAMSTIEIEKDASGAELVFARINISGRTYNVKKALFNGSSSKEGSHLYHLRKSYFYIDNGETKTESNGEVTYSGGIELIVPYYYGVGVESSFFKVSFALGESTQKFDLTKAFKSWANDSTNNQLQGTVITDSNEIDVDENLDCTDLTVSGDKITINSSTLYNFKLEHPDYVNYPIHMANVTVRNLSFTVEFTFSLPTVQHVGFVNSGASEHSLLGKVYIPIADGEFEALSDSNIVNIVGVEHSVNDYITVVQEVTSGVVSDLKVLLDNANLTTYFETHEEYSLNVKLETSYGDVEFYVFVKRQVIYKDYTLGQSEDFVIDLNDIDINGANGIENYKWEEGDFVEGNEYISSEGNEYISSDGKITLDKDLIEEYLLNEGSVLSISFNLTTVDGVKYPLVVEITKIIP